MFVTPVPTRLRAWLSVLAVLLALSCAKVASLHAEDLDPYKTLMESALTKLDAKDWDGAEKCLPGRADPQA